MGQSWVDGHLPYTELWDLKPPIIFLFFAAIIYSFGKSFLAVRFFGVVIVALTAFFTYKIGKTAQSKKIGLWSAVGCVLLLSLFGSLQGVMSEHICMLFFVPALYLLVRYKKLWAYCCAGLLFGLAVMSKLNIAYVILVVGLYLLYQHYTEKKFWTGVGHLVGMGSSLLFVILLTLLPYYLQGQTEIWWNSVVMAPIEYSASQQNPIYKTAPFCLIILAFLFFTWKKKVLNFNDGTVAILIVTIIGIILMFLLGGRVNGHYLIQFHPIFIVLFAMVASQIELFQSKKLLHYLPVILLLLPIESHLEYANIINNRWKKGTFYNGEGIDVPNYILEKDLETENILFLEYHIGYWMLEATPPTVAATHPSNILREALFPFYENPRKTGLEELRYIMETIKPQTVITRKNRKAFDEQYEVANTYIESYLKDLYKLDTIIGNANVHQRLE